MAEDKVIRVANAIASGCYDELVDKSDVSREQYQEQYAHLFVAAARKAIAELEGVNA